MFSQLSGAGPTGRSATSHPAIDGHLLVVLGEGGHTTELLHLIDLLGAAYAYTYIVADEDEHSAEKIRHPGRVYRVPRPRHRPGKRHDFFWDAWLAMRCFCRSVSVIRRIRPAVLLTTGPWLGLVTALAAKLFGIRVIFIETGSRVTSLSATGKAMKFVADDFFVQWEGLRTQVSKGRYAGRLW